MADQNYTINQWQIKIDVEEIDEVVNAIKSKSISLGPITKEFEKQLGKYLGVSHVVATTSGSVALLMALMAAEVGHGDEVIVPNRTWVAAPHAALLLGAKVVLVDVESDRPIINASLIEKHITKNTKVIMPVHMNGRAADMIKINDIAKKYNLFVIEDAAQAIGSRNSEGYLGTQSDIGCFSLSVAKTITTGQGGFLVTDNDELAYKLRAKRTHGVENVKDPKNWIMPGLNFRFTDMQSAIGIVQLKKIDNHIDCIKKIYKKYLDGLSSKVSLKPIPVNVDLGEIPLYNEYLVDNRDDFIKDLNSKGIDIRPFYPDLDYAPYMNQGLIDFPNSRKFGTDGIYLPSGPAQKDEDVDRVIESLL